MASKIYYRARQVCLQMLRDRKYTVPNFAPLTEQEFEIMYDAKQMDLSGIIDNNGKPCFVKMLHPDFVWNAADKRRAFNNIANYFKNNGHPEITNDEDLTDATDQGEIRLIFVLQNMDSKLEKTYVTNPFIEIHQADKLAIDPFECKYQKTWRLLPSTETKEILERYDAKPIMMGSVCIDDRINRYYRGQLGQVYEINRNGTGVFYRKVIMKKINLKQGESKTD